MAGAGAGTAVRTRLHNHWVALALTVANAQDAAVHRTGVNEVACADVIGTDTPELGVPVRKHVRSAVRQEERRRKKVSKVVEGQLRCNRGITSTADNHNGMPGKPPPLARPTHMYPASQQAAQQLVLVVVLVPLNPST